MPSRSLAFRAAAVLLAALLSLSGSGVSMAHGIAHIREHRAADHHGDSDHHGVARLRALADAAHDDHHRDDRADHDEAREPVALVADGLRGAPEIGTPDEPAAHQHARLDALVVTRLAIAAFLPAMPVLVPALPVIAATVPVPPAAAPLRLAEPPTGPPPPSRAPPIG